MNPQPIRSASHVPASDPGTRARVASEPSRGPGADAAPKAGSLPLEAALNGGGAAISAAQAAEAMTAANRWLEEKGSELTVEFDDTYGRAIFRLVDSQTGSLVRQIPSPEMLAISRALSDEATPGALLRTDA